MTAAEQRAQGLAGAQRPPLASVLAEDGREIREVLAGADGTRMKIDARVCVARADRVESFDLVTAEPDAELAKSVFFANALDLVALEPLEDPEPGRQLWTVRTPHPRDEFGTFIATYDQTVNEGESYFSYAFNSDIVENPYRELTPIPIETLDMEHAGAALKDILQRFSIPDFSTVYSMEDESSIHLLFAPRFTPLPLMPPGKQESGIKYAAGFSERGLFYLTVGPYVKPGNVTPIDGLLSVDQALGIVRENLGTELIPYKGKPIDGITLCHEYRYDESAGLYRAHPVWYFHMEEEPVRDVDYGEGDGSEPVRTDFTRYTSSFAVDAATGVLCAVTEEELWDDD
ncbi:MAG: hypothetical protein VB067_14420 [Christensenellaceae bacterium]|nr:hypothetical protein [Christensenellaceae bacterium]MEA5066854.1 hypothetical protein [Eubacteriales bacterium]MEA5070183.1 hypothetical protein [Christensenellaceae bacterium]